MSAQGFLTDRELTQVQDNMRLANRTAAAWFRWAGRSRADGRRLRIVGPAGAYRSRATSLDMRRNPRAYNITPGIINQIPGPHELGVCVDVDTNDLGWAIRTGREHGFTRPTRTVAMGDLNHFQHDVDTLGPASSSYTPIPIAANAPEEDVMKFKWINSTDGRQYVITPSKGLVYIQNPQEYLLLKRVDDGYLDVMNAAEVQLLTRYL